MMSAASTAVRSSTTTMNTFTTGRSSSTSATNRSSGGSLTRKAAVTVIGSRNDGGAVLECADRDVRCSVERDLFLSTEADQVLIPAGASLVGALNPELVAPEELRLLPLAHDRELRGEVRVVLDLDPAEAQRVV